MTETSNDRNKVRKGLRTRGESFPMKRPLSLASLAAIVTLAVPAVALAGQSEYEALIATHAQANGVPEALVHRVIVRESRYQPNLVGRGGTIGLMQIKLATARGMGYTGDAAGLRDPNTNLTYAVKYLAGAYRAAHGDHARAMHYYAAGYYQVAKRQQRDDAGGRLEHSGNPLQPLQLIAPQYRLARSATHARVSRREPR
jgi:soluble lytic murein transglycosylase-like protein